MHLFQHLIATLNKQLTGPRVIILFRKAFKASSDDILSQK